MYAAIVFLPLLGFLIAGLFGRLIGARASELVTTSLLFVAAALSWVTFINVAMGDAPATVSLLGEWFSSGALKAEWSLRIDSLTAVMLIVVTTVSALVHLYSIGYMEDDPSQSRFFSYLSLFTFAMLALVTADNLLQMFFGWEGVGLASYLLIGFWYQKPSANAAAIKAFVVNRVGDFGFLLGIFMVFLLTRSIGFDQIFAAAPGLANTRIHVFGADFDAMTITCLLLFMGAMGKSAQFLLHTWLPDAMEGPTPVSALIHAATMVTAGVFMVARLSPLFEQAPVALSFVIFIGATTAFFAATVGLVQNDIKRVIAYSTCSQLGYMFVALGVGGYSIGIFHLFTHAFFKALLFLGAGAVIVAMHHEQDMRRMGGLWRKIPFTFAMMTVGTLALTGFPLTSGYFSKDAIIDAAFASHRPMAFYGYLMTVIAAALTSFYSWRLVFLTFFGKAQWAADAHGAAGHGHGVDAHAAGHADDDHDTHGHGDHQLDPHEAPVVMLIPLAALAVGALFAGAYFRADFIGEGVAEFWKNALYFGANNHILAQMEEVPFIASIAPTVMMVLGFLVALYIYILAPGTAARLAEAMPALYRFLLNKWYFDELYDKIFVRPAFWLGRLFWKGGDGAIIDRLGPDGVAAWVVDVTGRVVKLQSGYIYHYAFAMLIGLAAITTWYLVGGLR
ncbi:NADH-quinone oxidoreductase subunit L [Methylocella tundrae]|uniref:NADH-quinone oxidoreductase chain 12 n=1 Tax=Methylocella tundrae TaxID=227605 RepID=A0A4U8Z200_METTU|nr:NADH-quinone oxidoreductase subunit L [Methylocella tundrae]WPP03308.1 NADH-quinone oxidoreductase subunit L [Methylocella tundrae]VFU09341.1 NADH-quinone oxidoreductase chain 12 [Methylocella tundrae]